MTALNARVCIGLCSLLAVVAAQAADIPPLQASTQSTPAPVDLWRAEAAKWEAEIRNVDAALAALSERQTTGRPLQSQSRLQTGSLQPARGVSSVPPTAPGTQALLQRQATARTRLAQAQEQIAQLETRETTLRPEIGAKGEFSHPVDASAIDPLDFDHYFPKATEYLAGKVSPENIQDLDKSVLEELSGLRALRRMSGFSDEEFRTAMAAFAANWKALGYDGPVIAALIGEDMILLSAVKKTVENAGHVYKFPESLRGQIGLDAAWFGPRGGARLAIAVAANSSHLTKDEKLGVYVRDASGREITLFEAIERMGKILRNHRHGSSEERQKAPSQLFAIAQSIISSANSTKFSRQMLLDSLNAWTPVTPNEAWCEIEVSWFVGM